jgi:membrane fusion protein (multidrug efflux system)
MNTATLTASTTESPRAGLTAASLPQPAQTNHAPRFELNVEADAAAPVKIRRPFFTRTALIALAAVAGIGVAKFSYDWWTTGRFTQTTDDAFVGGDVTVIAPKVAGFISQLAVTDNQAVHAGDLLLKLDDRDYRAALAKAEAAVSLAKAALVNLDATRDLQDAVIAQAQAGIAAADAEITRTHDDQVRAKNLLASAIDSTQEFQQADADYKTATANGDKARATLSAAQRQIEVIGTQKQQAQASLDAAIAERDLAQLNLSYTELRAPMDGIVGNRSAQVGAYATVGSQLISLVPAHGLWIDANYKEDQLARMHTGSPATVQIDLLGGKKFNGHVLSIAPATGAQFSVLPAENATGNFTKIVQRVAVRIMLDDEQAMAGQLRPGLSVTAKVKTKS